MTLARRVMLVDDSAEEGEFVARALGRHYPGAELMVVQSGEEALARLDASVEKEAPCPADLLLLDLKLPRVDGHAVLEAVRRRFSAGELPVVVFTSSREPADLGRAYALGANSYVVKPVVYEAYAETVGAVVRYWLDLNVRVLPTTGAPGA